MLKEVEYEMILAKMFYSFTAAVVLIGMVVVLMGIKITTCRPIVLLVNVALIGMLLLAASVILDEKK